MIYKCPDCGCLIEGSERTIYWHWALENGLLNESRR